MFSVEQLLETHYPRFSNDSWFYKPLTSLMKYLLHEKDIQTFSAEYPHLKGLEFVEQILDYFEFSYSSRIDEKENIPSHGRVVIISNHPIGSLDGLALIKLISEIRQDVKVMANQMLMTITPLHSLLLPVNNMQGGTSKKCLNRISAHLNNEGALIVFPAGEVSRLHPAGIRDCKWRTGFLRIAKSTNSPILPVYVDGKNSLSFYVLSMLYKPLATLMLVKEMFKQRKKHLKIRIGEIIPQESYEKLSFSASLMAKLFKKHLYSITKEKEAIFSTQKPIALPENRAVLTKALKNCEQLGLTADGKEIYLYQNSESSPILRELGRLREIAFRAVGEGTYLRRDLDIYDTYYYHLLLWDSEDLEIVGAYRLGDASQLKDNDVSKLYTSTLFTYNKNMNPYFAQGLELGRSFVQPRYWGKRSLDYLWYGIGAFLVKHPQYRYLFGPVSLSNSYPRAAKELIVNFYQLYFSSDKVIASSNQPFVFSSMIPNEFDGKDYKEDFKKFKQNLSNMGVSVPTLYKQYTELCELGGVQFLDFGIDPEFNDCVDGLILVDIQKLKKKKLKRYFAEM